MAIENRKDDYIISASQISTFLSCQEKFRYRYVERLEPVTKADALDRGTVIHKCIQAHWSSQSPIKILADWQREKKESMLPWEYEQWEGTEYRSVVDLMGRYVEHWGPKPEDVTLLATEFELTPTIKPGLRMLGYIDMLAHWQGKLWIIECKTARNLNRRLSYLDADAQITAYIWGLRAHGLDEVAGVMFDGVNTYPYKDRSKQPGDKLFQRVTVFRTPEQLDSFEQDLLITADDIQKTLARGEFSHNLGPSCQQCDFRELCHARIRGDLKTEEAHLRTDFKVRLDNRRPAR